MNSHHARILRRAKLVKVLTLLGLVAFILACASVPGKAHAADTTDKAAIAAAADGLSTVAVVGTGVGAEVGLIAHPPVFAAVAVAKVVTPYAVRDASPETRKTVIQTTTALFGGGAANNTTILVAAKVFGVKLVGALAGLPVAAGIAVGYYLWEKSGVEFDAEQRGITAPDAGAALAMATPPIAPEVMP